MTYIHLDTDDYFWEPTDPPFMKKRCIKERINLIKNDLVKWNDVVLTGSLCGWGDELIPQFDLVIRLITPTKQRIERIEEREFQRFGTRIREGGDMYQDHIKFIKWASEYDDGDATMRSKARHDQWEKNIPCPHITLDGTHTIERLLTERPNEFLHLC